jgi:hypothetical protein
MREHDITPARGAAPAATTDLGEHRRHRLAYAQRALQAKRHARDQEIAERLGYENVHAWYADRRAARATNAEMCREAGMGETWLRRLARQWRDEAAPASTAVAALSSSADAAAVAG